MGDIMKKDLNNIAIYVKKTRREYGLSQVGFALRCGVGLRFLRDLEQGKTNLNNMLKSGSPLQIFSIKEKIP